jgi:hypothetical protein
MLWVCLARTREVLGGDKQNRDRQNPRGKLDSVCFPTDTGSFLSRTNIIAYFK